MITSLAIFSNLMVSFLSLLAQASTAKVSVGWGLFLLCIVLGLVVVCRPSHRVLVEKKTKTTKK